MTPDKSTRPLLHGDKIVDEALLSTQDFRSPLAPIQGHQIAEEDNDRTPLNGRNTSDMLTSPSSAAPSLLPHEAQRDPLPRPEITFAQQAAPLQDHLYPHNAQNDVENDLSSRDYPSQNHAIYANGSAQTFNAAIQPTNGFQGWLDPYQDHSLFLHDTLDMWSDSAISHLLGMPSDLPDLPTPGLRESRQSDSKERIPVERFGRVQQLWPTKRERSRPLMQSLWREVAVYSEDGLFSLCGDDTSLPSAVSGSHTRPWWGLDEDRRRQLARDYNHTSLSDRRESAEAPAPIRSGKDPNLQESLSQSEVSGVHNFPSAEILDMSLDQYFRRFHPRMPFIHRPTFTAKSTPNTLLFAMCLMGLKLLLKGESAKRFILAHVRVSRLDHPSQPGVLVKPADYISRIRVPSTSVAQNWPRKQYGHTSRPCCCQYLHPHTSCSRLR